MSKCLPTTIPARNLNRLYLIDKYHTPFQDDFHIKFIELARSDLPNLAKIDVEMSDEENVVSFFFFEKKTANVSP